MNEWSKTMKEKLLFIGSLVVSFVMTISTLLAYTSWSNYVTARNENVQLTSGDVLITSWIILSGSWEASIQQESIKANWWSEQRDDLKKSKLWFKDQYAKTKTKWENVPTKEAMEYSVDSIGLWIDNWIRSIQVKIGKEFWINPKYLALVWMSEAIYNPRWVGDNWCSYWIYQFNKCPWNRAEQIWYWKKFNECSLDYECATKMLAEKIRSAYKCIVVDGAIQNRSCLYKHQWIVPSQRYKNNMDKNYDLLFNQK